LLVNISRGISAAAGKPGSSVAASKDVAELLAAAARDWSARLRVA
jgi:hypothetical protein